MPAIAQRGGQALFTNQAGLSALTTKTVLEDGDANGVLQAETAVEVQKDQDVVTHGVGAL